MIITIIKNKGHYLNNSLDQIKKLNCSKRNQAGKKWVVITGNSLLSAINESELSKTQKLKVKDFPGGML